MKNRTETLIGKLMMNEVLEKLWMYLMVYHKITVGSKKRHNISSM